MLELPTQLRLCAQSSPPRPAPLPGAGAPRRPPCSLGNTSSRRRGPRVGHDVGAKVACRNGAGLVARVPRTHGPRLAARTLLTLACHSGRGSTDCLGIGHRRSAERRSSDLCYPSGTTVLTRGLNWTENSWATPIPPTRRLTSLGHQLAPCQPRALLAAATVQVATKFRTRVRVMHMHMHMHTHMRMCMCMCMCMLYFW